MAAAYQSFGGDPVADHGFIHETIEAANWGKIKSSRPVFAKKFGISVEEWAQAVTGQYQHDPILLAYITQLRKDYKTALLSNIAQGGLTHLWEEGELDQYFDLAVGSGDLKLAKPDPKVYNFVTRWWLGCDTKDL